MDYTQYGKDYKLFGTSAGSLEKEELFFAIGMLREQLDKANHHLKNVKEFIQYCNDLYFQ